MEAASCGTREEPEDWSNKVAEVSKLLTTMDKWSIRKIVLHDFSESSEFEYIIKLTMDVDWVDALGVKQNQERGADDVTLPIEMRPKESCISFDVTVDGKSVHVLHRSQNVLVAVKFLQHSFNKFLEESEFKGKRLPNCLLKRFIEIAEMNPDEYGRVRDGDKTITLQDWVDHFGTRKGHREKCAATKCPGDSMWKEACNTPEFRNLVMVFSRKYIRSILAPHSKSRVSVVKTAEVSEGDPFSEIRRPRTFSLWGWIDISNFTLRNTVRVNHAADISLVKCVPPKQAVFQPTLPPIAESGECRDRAESENEPLHPDGLRVHPSLSWSYLSQPREERGAWFESRARLVDVQSRRASLIFPAFMLSLMGFLSQLHLLILVTLLHIEKDGERPSKSINPLVDVPVQGAIAIGLPLLVAAYASVSRHIILARFLSRYRNWLIAGMIASTVLLGATSLYAATAFVCLGVSMAIMLLLVIIFGDALAQSSTGYYRKRREFLRLLRVSDLGASVLGSVTLLFFLAALTFYIAPWQGGGALEGSKAVFATASLLAFIFMPILLLTNLGYSDCCKELSRPRRSYESSPDAGFLEQGRGPRFPSMRPPAFMVGNAIISAILMFPESVTSGIDLLLAFVSYFIYLAVSFLGFYSLSHKWHREEFTGDKSVARRHCFFDDSHYRIS